MPEIRIPFNNNNVQYTLLSWDKPSGLHKPDPSGFIASVKGKENCSGRRETPLIARRQTFAMPRLSGRVWVTEEAGGGNQDQVRDRRKLLLEWV